MFGGDWPVILLADNFELWLNSLKFLLKDLSDKELIKIFYTNAQRVYRL